MKTIALTLAGAVLCFLCGCSVFSTDSSDAPRGAAGGAMEGVTTQNAVITKFDGKYLYYRRECGRCGAVEPKSIGSRVPNKGPWTIKSDFACSKCGAKMTARISGKGSFPDRVGAAAPRNKTDVAEKKSAPERDAAKRNGPNDAMMDIVAKNAVITKFGAEYFFYQRKCSKCGAVEPRMIGLECHKGPWTVKSDFVCAKCGASETTEISRPGPPAEGTVKQGPR